MITSRLQFGADSEPDSEDEGMSLATRVLSIDEARALIDVCKMFDYYLSFGPEHITVENYTFGCWTEFRAPPQEITILAFLLDERLPPPLHSHFHWLDHARNEHYNEMKERSIAH